MLSGEGKKADRGTVGAEFIGYNRRPREALLLQEFPHQRGKHVARGGHT